MKKIAIFTEGQGELIFMERISSQITATDIDDAFERGRSMSLATFISHITTRDLNEYVALLQA